MDIPKEVFPIGKVYDDALSPAVKQVGQILENTVKVGRFLLAPIDYLANQQDRWQRYLKRISESVSEDNLVEGHPQIVIPAMQGLSLSYEDTLLSELFIKLLGNSIDKTKQDLAHPAFPGIISQLSHDEAVVLFYLKNLDCVFKKRHDLSKNRKSIVKTSYMVNIPVDKLQFPEHLELYFSHLSSLNLIKMYDNYNESFDTDPKTGNQINIYENTKIVLNDFGVLFCNACVPKRFGELMIPDY